MPPGTPMPPPRLIITRPAAEARRWALDLAASGIQCSAWPLIDIAPAPWQGPLAQAHAALGQGAYHAAMFVSGQAVQHFLRPQTSDEKGQTLLVQQTFSAIETRAWAPGPGTRNALLQVGWPAARIDTPAPDAAQLDSESLWPQIAPQLHPGLRVLLVRGAGADGLPAGRDWLRQQLLAAGVQVDQVAAYRRLPPQWDAARQRQAQDAAQDGSLWLFSSSEAIANLRQCAPGIHWGQARALTTHPRIARAAQTAGFGQVQCCQPQLPAVLAFIESAA